VRLEFLVDQVGQPRQSQRPVDQLDQADKYTETNLLNHGTTATTKTTMTRTMMRTTRKTTMMTMTKNRQKNQRTRNPMTNPTKSGAACHHVDSAVEMATMMMTNSPTVTKIRRLQWHKW
jgi:hypothetical protein